MYQLKSKKVPLFIISVLFFLSFFVLSSKKVYAATLTVNSTADTSDASAGDGSCATAGAVCTLRAAIEEANVLAGADTINFNIAGTGVHTLTPASAYDTITQSVTIDGYSQPGSAVNTAVSPNPFNGTLTIEIDGTNAGGSSNGLFIDSSDVTIRGLVINRFEYSGIRLESGNNSNIVISGNYIGTDPNGLADLGNVLDGIEYQSSGTGNLVGGTTASARNILSGNSGSGLRSISGGSNLLIQGNYFGLDANGVGILPNDGNPSGGNIAISGSSNFTIGGSTVYDRNVVSGSPSGFVFYQSTGMKVQGNYLGTNANGSVQTGFGNSVSAIIFVGDSQNNLIGGANSGEGNIVAGNGAGVMVGDLFGSFLALNNSIIGNSIHSNSGGSISTLGIDLLGNTDDFANWSDAGVTANDAADPDVTSNVLMNFPVITSITSSNGQATITYDLDINDAEPGATGYRVEFFANDGADPSGHGQGQTYLGSETVAGDVTNRSTTIALPSGVSGSKYITATATMTDASDDGFGHTSEFAENVQATLVASGTSSSSPNSLADTGQNINPIILLSLLLLTSGLAVTAYQRRRSH
ncbi:CSLREA domain-containing protein [Candidatus Nomurabacteria bacterium]|nr:CSLREA domain-containing protein [Candidatus Nomurabacteria bacterium]